MRKIFLLLPLAFGLKVLRCQNLLPVLLNDEWGYIDTSGKISIEPQYNYASFFYNSKFSVVKCKNKFSIINPNNIPYFDYKYDSIVPLRWGYLAVKQQNKWGVITQDDKQIIKCELDSIKKTGNLIKIYKNNLCGLLLNDLKVIYPKYDNIFNFSDRLMMVVVNNKHGLINLSDKYVLQPEYENIIKITDTILRIGRNNKWGVVDLYNNFKIEPKWNRFEFFKKGYVKGYLDDRAELIKYPSAQLVSNNYDDYFEGNKDYIIIKKGFKTGLINYQGKETVNPIYDGLIFLHDNYFVAENKEKRGLIDCVKGDTIVSILYDDIAVFQNTCNLKLLEIVNNKKIGIVNYQDQIIIPTKYTDVVCRRDSSYLVKNRGLLGLYNKNGKQIFPTKFNTIGYYENNTIIARFENCYAIANRDTVLSSIRNDRIIVAAKTAKLYRNDTLEVVSFSDDGSLLDIFPYVGIESYKIDAKDPLPLSTNYEKNDVFDGPVYSIEYSIKLGKWGIMENKVKRFLNNPVYDRVYDLPNGDYKLTEIFTSPTVVKIGNVLFTSHSLFGLVNLTTGLEVLKNEYIFIQYDGKVLKNNQNPTNYAINKNGEWSIIDVPKNNINYIDEKSTNSIVRFYKDGGLEVAGYDESSSTVLFRDFVNTVSSNGSLWLTDSSGYKYYAMDDKYLNCVNGSWSYYSFTLPGLNPNDDFRGNDEYAYAEPFLNQQSIAAKDKNGFGVLNKSKKEIIPFNYSSIRFYQTEEDVDGYIISKIIPNYGFINQKGERIIECKYQEAGKFSEKLSPLELNGKWGFADKSGEIIIDFKYKNADVFLNGYSIVFDGKYYGAINSKGDTILPFKYSYLSHANDSLVVFESQRKYGIISIVNGDTIILPFYKNKFEFNRSGLAIVKSDDGYGVINTKGKVVVKDKYDKLGNISLNNLIWAKEKKNYKLFDAFSGNKLSSKYSKLFDESNSLILYKGRKLFGYLNTKGEVFIKEKYRNALPFINNLAIVKEKKYFGVIDTDGNTVIPFEWESIEYQGDNFLVRNPKGKFMIINKEGKILFQLNEIKIVSGYQNGIAIAKNKIGQVFFIDEKGENIFNLFFDAAEPYNEGMARVKIKEKWGLLDEKGEFILQPTYHSIDTFYEQRAMVSISPVFGACSFKGNILIEPLYEEITPVGNNIFLVKKDKKMGYIKSNGSWIWNLQ